ncbi:MAG: SCO family protein [Alphaproteobacteria bacterium]|nr:SCO family protein [Alphaproteobacteria bacterium]
MARLGRSSTWPRLAAGLFAVALTAGFAAPAAAEKPFDDEAAFKYSQAAIGRTVGDHAFRDRAGRTVRLADYRGQPLIVSMIYTSCAQACPVISHSLQKAIEVAQKTVGLDEFRIVTVGFDARVDSPERMRIFASQQGIKLPNWEFLSADAATIDRLSEDMGFIFFASAKGFDHLSQTTILTGEGKVFRQVYGEEFDPPHLVEPLKDLIFGRVTALMSWEGIVNRVKLYCTVFDPNAGRYRFDYRVPVIVGVGGLTMLGIGFFVVRAWIHYFRRQRKVGKMYGGTNGVVAGPRRI